MPEHSTPLTIFDSNISYLNQKLLDVCAGLFSAGASPRTTRLLDLNIGNPIIFVKHSPPQPATIFHNSGLVFGGTIRRCSLSSSNREHCRSLSSEHPDCRLSLRWKPFLPVCMFRKPSTVSALLQASPHRDCGLLSREFRDTRSLLGINTYPYPKASAHT